MLIRHANERIAQRLALAEERAAGTHWKRRDAGRRAKQPIHVDVDPAAWRRAKATASKKGMTIGHHVGTLVRCRRQAVCPLLTRTRQRLASSPGSTSTSRRGTRSRRAATTEERRRLAASDSSSRPLHGYRGSRRIIARCGPRPSTIRDGWSRQAILIGSIGGALRKARCLLNDRSAGCVRPVAKLRRLQAPGASSRPRDLPDPLGWADFAANGSLTASAVAEHVRAGLYPQPIELVPLPKSGKPGLRWLTDFHAYDELTLRVLVGRIVAPIAAKVDRSIVFSAEVSGRPPGWSLAPHRPAHRRRQERGLELLAVQRCAGLLVLDVRDFFGSITLDHLGPALVGMGAPEGAVASIALALRRWSLDGLEGVPVGFEGSALMANSFLSPGDEALVRLGLGVVRWMDDTWAFLGSTDDPWFVEQVYDANLRSLGLSVNGDKTYFAEGPMAEFVVRDAFLDSVTKGGDSRIDEDEALVILMTAVEDDGVAVAWPWVRFALGALRGHRSGAALEVLQDRSDLFMEEPKAVGDYLEAVAEGSDRRQLDKDWLVELATVPCSERGVSRRIHACRALRSARGASTSSNSLVRDAITDSSLPSAVQRWSAAAWARRRGMEGGSRS